IFLDEIGELPLSMQTKLLHVIEAKEVRPLGSEQSRKVDVRLISATNRDLPDMVAHGRFREDLFFRLSVFQIGMPPLRDRRADSPALVQHLMSQRIAPAGSAPALTIDPEAQEMLVSYHWPGNVRQLENVLHRAAILADGGCIRAADLPPEVSRVPAGAPSAQPSDDPGAEIGLRERVRRFEVSLILRAIDEAGGDRRTAAQRLGIGLSSLYRKLEEFQGTPPPVP
ncbi:MAG: sigma-54-dependent Fis family transcriptional regulator, partial [Ideonella sp.]|nr:sigma-54-dependent Fis family transcriptional regulator [Ideonella sp.]